MHALDISKTFEQKNYNDINILKWLDKKNAESLVLHKANPHCTTNRLEDIILKILPRIK